MYVMSLRSNQDNSERSDETGDTAAEPSSSQHEDLQCAM